METLQRQAEGLGSDVAELLAITNRNRPKKREGYFSTLARWTAEGPTPRP